MNYGQLDFIYSSLKMFRWLTLEDVQECGDYGGIKLMSHCMKIWEKMIHKKVTFIKRNQFMPGRSTNYNGANILFIHIVSREIQIKEYVYGIYWSSNRISREINEESITNMNVNLFENMDKGRSKRVKSLCGENYKFTVRIGVHQGSDLSLCLFSLVWMK